MSSSTDHVDHLIDNYLHDLVPSEQHILIENHCAKCSTCNTALEQGRRRLGLLRSLPIVEPSSTLVHKTIARIERGRISTANWRGRLGYSALLALAASVLILLGLNIYFYSLKYPTIDLIALGQSDLLASSMASLRVRLLDRGSRTPFLAGVPVVVTLKSKDGRTAELGRFETDQHGNASPRFDVPDWPDGNYSLLISAQTPTGTEVIHKQVHIRRSWNLMLSTDRPVYQPGQIIRTRALALRRPDLKPVAETPAVFTLTDPKGNVLFKHTQPTSRFGLCHAECPLAAEIQEGTYTLECRIGDTTSKQSIVIQRYVLPKFKIAISPDRPYYQPGEEGKLAIKVDYFFGKPVVNGNVKVTVSTKDAQEKVVTILKGVTDKDGKVIIGFKVPQALIGRGSDAGDARLTFSTKVRDNAGQEQVRLVEQMVTTRPIRVTLIPEGGRLVNDVENRMYAMVQRADGQPVPGVRVSIQGEGINEKFQVDSTGTGIFHLRPNRAQYEYQIKVFDGDGNELTKVPQAGRLDLTTVAGDFLIRTDRPTYQAGQSMHITALGDNSREPIFLDLIKDGQSVLSEMIEMENGKGELTLDLPPTLIGTVRFVAYRFLGSEQMPIRKQRIVYIDSPRSLQIKAEFDKVEYRPGEKAQVSLQLVDEQGKPTPGALSLAAVDEAVYSILAQRPGMEQQFYLLEQELLKPIYSISSWLPHEKASTGQRERALFAATSRIDPTSKPLHILGTPVVNPDGPYTLASTTLATRRQEVHRQRLAGLEMVRKGWLLLGLITALGLYVTLWFTYQPETVLKMHGIALIIFVVAGIGLTVLSYTFLPGIARETFSAVGFNIGGAEVSASKSAPGSRALQNSDTKSESRQRVREFFPETLLWKPEVITDDQGKLPPLDISMADSITNWQFTASAVSADGRLGAIQKGIKVFQPFFVDLHLPVALTRGDEVGIPIVVYNYLDREQKVKLSLTKADWFTLEGTQIREIELQPGEVRSVIYSLKVTRVGVHKVEIKAESGDATDAIRREIEVVPDGYLMERASSGSLDQPAEIDLNVPVNSIKGSVKAYIKIYPSSLSQVVEGLDNIFQMPNGCFEQTSSTTYPNVLALDYLRRNKLTIPGIEAKARKYIHLGYQRLVGFEVEGGGFDWYGRPPANVVLTAYGLMEFEDMSRVHDVDSRLIARTRHWLLNQRKSDGTWEFQDRTSHLVSGQDQHQARLAVTSYVAWAVFRRGQSPEYSRSTWSYLLSHQAKDISDPQTLALVCNALQAINPDASEIAPYLDQLANLAKRSIEGKYVTWDRPASRRTLFYSAGISGKIETTALAIIALAHKRQYPTEVSKGLAWLIAQKDPRGTWHSTQATILALRALLLGRSSTRGEEKDRRIAIQIGKHSQTLVISRDQAEVLRYLDITPHISTGRNVVKITDLSNAESEYQVVFRYHVPAKTTKETTNQPLNLKLTYDRKELQVGQWLTAKVEVTNNQNNVAPMVMLTLPIPPGFRVHEEDYQLLVRNQTIARYQVTPRTILIYLRKLPPKQALEFTYVLESLFPVKGRVPPGHVYEYYNPDDRGQSEGTTVQVIPRP